jgi:hypothetical protein
MDERDENETLTGFGILKADAAWEAWPSVRDAPFRATPCERLVIESEELLEVVAPKCRHLKHHALPSATF